MISEISSIETDDTLFVNNEALTDRWNVLCPSALMEQDFMRVNMDNVLPPDLDYLEQKMKDINEQRKIDGLMFTQ